MLNPAFFNPGSGIGPQTGGFSPTPADNIYSQLRRNSSQGLMEYALYTDPRTRALAGMGAMGLSGDPAQAARMLSNSAQGQLIKDTVGVAMSAGLVPGGNPMQMAASVQQMVSTQGFTVGGNLGRGGPLFGSGAITDLISRSVFDNLKSNYFDQVTGLAKRNTFGMDMSQMGQALGQLTSRGAFAGMRIGDLKSFTNVADIEREIAATRGQPGQQDYLKELESLKNKGGGNIFKRDQGQWKKVQDIFSDYAATLQDARKIFGDLPIAELTQNAERLIGTSLKDLGSLSMMRNRMANIQATASAYGLNPAAVASRVMDVTDSLQQKLFAASMSDPKMQFGYNQAAGAYAFGRTAASMSERAVLSGLTQAHQMNATARMYGERGVYMPTMDESTLTNIRLDAMTSLAEEKGTFGNVDAALFSLSQGDIQDPAKRDRINSILSDMKTADIPTSRALNAELAKIMESEGINVAKLKATTPASEMQRRMGIEYIQKRTDLLEAKANFRPVDEGLKDISEQGADFGLMDDTMSGNTNRANIGRLFSTLNAETRDKLIGLFGADGSLSGENKAAVEAMYRDIPGLAELLPQSELEAMMKSLGGSEGRAAGALPDQLKKIFFKASSMAQMAPVTTAQDRRDAQARAVQAYLTENALGGSVTPETFATDLVRGFFGTGKISDQMVLESLKNKGGGTIFDLNADKTAFDIPLNRIGDIEKVLGEGKLKELYSTLGLEAGDTAGLAQKLGTAEGADAFRKALNAAGAMASPTGDGKFMVGSAAEVDQENKLLEIRAAEEHAKRLLGTSGGIPSTDMSTPAGREEYFKTLREGLTANDSERFMELADAAIAKGFQGSEMETLTQAFKADPQLQKILEAKQKELADTKGFFGGPDEEAIDKANKLRQLGRQIQASNAGEQGQYLGVLQILSDSMSQLQLYKQ